MFCFCFISVYKSLQTVLHSMITEKERLKQTVETQNLTSSSSTSINPAVVSLKQTLGEVSYCIFPQNFKKNSM